MEEFNLDLLTLGRQGGLGPLSYIHTDHFNIGRCQSIYCFVDFNLQCHPNVSYHCS